MPPVDQSWNRIAKHQFQVGIRCIFLHLFIYFYLGHVEHVIRHVWGGACAGGLGLSNPWETVEIMPKP